MAEDQKLLFEADVIHRLDQATSKTGYLFAGILEIIDNMGAAEAARMLVGPNSTGKFHEGFEFLVRQKISHLSIEQAVIDFKDSGLFSADEVSSARARIAMAKMLFDKE
jgi:hypothetical protein